MPREVDFSRMDVVMQEELARIAVLIAPAVARLGTEDDMSIQVGDRVTFTAVGPRQRTGEGTVQMIVPVSIYAGQVDDVYIVRVDMPYVDDELGTTILLGAAEITDIVPAATYVPPPEK